ncbi:YdcH family protein [Pseudoxanthomonas sp. PXM02]|uniref:YdcH family protein n=1 Tax=Pseudoxanthomonas sp. PXM02 TaxID=2769294 RepID=UPI0031F2DFF4
METDNPADIPEKIAALRTEHRDLDEAIARLVDDADADEVAIKRLKKRKLWLKDCIARLESALIPDEPA